MPFKLFVNCAVACCVMWAPSFEGHDGASSTNSRDNYARALEFVTAAYPGLRNRALGVDIAGNYWRALNGTIHELRSFTLLIGEGPDPDVPGGERAPILTMNFDFSDEGCLERVTADGPFTQLEKRRAIEKVIAANRGISKDGVSSALNSAGARFGPSRERELRANALEMLKRVGPLIEAPSIASLYWSQDDMAIWNAVIDGNCSGTTRKYNALFEPFDGKFLSLQKMAP